MAEKQSSALPAASRDVAPVAPRCVLSSSDHSLRRLMNVGWLITVVHRTNRPVGFETRRNAEERGDFKEEIAMDDQSKVNASANSSAPRCSASPRFQNLRAMHFNSWANGVGIKLSR